MENNRSSWGSNLGFLMAAIGSARWSWKHLGLPV